MGETVQEETPGRKKVDSLPEDEQGVLIKIISAYVRDCRAKQAYAS
jgi:hypothetical protein